MGIAQVIRVLLVDDESVVRRGLRMRLALEPDLEVVGAAGNSAEALLLARTATPDVVVMDVKVQDGDGVKAIRQMRALVPDCAVVVLTLHGGRANQAQALEAGAQAFVEKQGGVDRLLAEIRRLAHGGA
jgi:DNA-binding NarL/FixJ family response regulator